MHFHSFLIISPWKRAEPFSWTNLNSLHQKMICAKFGWNWPKGSGDWRWKSEKFTTTSTTMTDNGQILSEKLTWALNLKKEKFTDKRTDKQTTDNKHLSFQLRWAKNCISKNKDFPLPVIFVYIWFFTSWTSDMSLSE